MVYTNEYESIIGGITLASNGVELIGLWFNGQKYFGSTLLQNSANINLPIFDLTKKWLDIYFSGNKPDFTPPIAINATPFRMAVWQILLDVPYGGTISYKCIADIIAKQRGIASMSAQAVGNAVGHNAISLIIPCHRVIGTDDSMTGYAAGVDKKIKLLALECMSISGKINK